MGEDGSVVGPVHQGGAAQRNVAKWGEDGTIGAGLRGGWSMPKECPAEFRGLR